MLRSLYSGISGMRVNQTKLDVIGNNIANVGTTGFKNARVRFQDMLSQNVSQALAPGVNQGGVNPRQVGLGVQMAGIDTIVSQGMMQPTGRNLDVAVDGDGYFMVGSGQLPFDNDRAITLNGSEVLDTNGMSISFTRDGSFTLDKSGNLLTSDGYRVLGYAMGVNGGESSVKYKDGRLESVNFVNTNDLSVKSEGTLVPLVIPDSISRPASNFAAGTKMPASSGNPESSPTISGLYTGETAVVEVKYTAASGEWSWFLNGKEQDNSIKPFVYNGVTIAPADPAPTTDSMWRQNLYAKSDEPVKVTTFNIGKDGVISAVLDDGSVSALGQIAMSSFKNPAGLTKLGRNLYEKSANSGDAIVRSGMNVPADQDNSGGYGDMLQGMLEMSNVDLAEQFTDMIVTSRAFQANSKTITTGDEILQDILNLKR